MIQIQRKYFKDYTEYSLPEYDFQPIIVPQGGKEMTADEDMADEFEGRVCRLFKRRIAEEMIKDLQFEFCTIEPQKNAEQRKAGRAEKRTPKG